MIQVLTDDTAAITVFNREVALFTMNDEQVRRIHRLNPSDNQCVCFLIDEVRAKTAWEDRREQR